jgi:DNA-binding transcriptional LysR family regulator
MQLNETLAFVTVVDAGSFTAAGKRLGVPKSTLSKQVTRLEQRLGARLLQRTTRKLSLTETGHAYFARCQNAIAEIADAERLAQDVSGTPKGRLRVSCPFDFGRDHLSRWTADFRRRYPEIELEIVLSQAQIDMIAEGIDVALRGGSLPDSSLVSRKLSASELLLVASPDYLDRRGRPESLAELLEHDAVSMPFPRQGFMIDGPNGPEPFRLDPWLIANEWGFLRRALLDGMGIGPSIIQSVHEDLTAGRLERVLPQYGLRRGGLYAVYPSRHHLSPKVRVFVDFVAERVAEQWSTLQAPT